MNIKGSEVFLWVLIGLAIVASVLMMFSDSDAWQKIAVLAALWAAALGAFLVMKMRGESKADADRVAQLENQLDRERARADEERARSEQAIARSEESDETLVAIREQLDAMRTQLEELTGRTYEYEPNSITASATRLREIGSRDSEPVGAPEETTTFTVVREPVEEEPEIAQVITSEDDESSGSHAESVEQEPEEEPVWEWTPPSSSYVEPSDSDESYHGRRRKEDEDPFAFDFLGSYGSADTEPEDAGYHGRRRAEDREEPAPGQPARLGGWTPVTDDEWRAPDPDNTFTARPDETSQFPTVREEPRGRRRAEDREGGVSVADLLKNLKK